MSASSEVSAAAQARIERAIDDKIDAFLESSLKTVGLADKVSTKAKTKLRGVLKKYAKETNPFKACVVDQTKQFGPGRAEAVCASIKDTIKTSKGFPSSKGAKVNASDDSSIDGEMLVALNALSEVDLQGVFMDARAMDEFGTVEGVGMLEVAAADELRRWGSDGEVGLAIAGHAKPEVTT